MKNSRIFQLCGVQVAITRASFLISINRLLIRVSSTGKETEQQSVAALHSVWGDDFCLEGLGTDTKS